MKSFGLSFVWILLSGLLVVPLGPGPTYATTKEQLLHPPSNLNATAISGTQVFLIWEPINDIQNLVSYKIESSPSCTGSFGFFANTATPIFLATGLTNGTCYQFHVSVITQSGISTPSNVISITTLSIPSQPSNLEATPVSTSQVNLSWKATASDGGTQITGYEIQRKNSCEGKYVTIGNTVNSTTYSDLGLSSNTCYQYQILATNAIGPSIPSNYTVTLTPQTNQTLSNDAPTGLQVNALSDSSLRLTWNPTTDNNFPVYGYVIQRNGTTIANEFSAKTTFVDAGLRPSHLETYRVAAWNNGHDDLFSYSVVGITPNIPPSPPLNLKATAVSSSQIDLIWDMPRHNGGLPIIGYKIERSTDMALHWSNVIANTRSMITSYSDSGLLSGTTYAYRVSAISLAGASSPSNIAWPTTLKLSTQIPDAPSDLIVFTVSDSELALFWNLPIYSGQGSIVGYQIQRNDTILVNNTASQDTIFNDIGLSPNHKVEYRVAAWNQVGLGMFSEAAWGVTANATINPQPTQEVNQTSIPSNSTNQTSGAISASSTNQIRISLNWNDLFNEQRMKEIHVIRECSAEIRAASSGNAIQIDDDCIHKFKVINQNLQEIKQQFEDSQNKLKQKFVKLKKGSKSWQGDDHQQPLINAGITSFAGGMISSVSKTNSYGHGGNGMSSYGHGNGMNSYGSEEHGESDKSHGNQGTH